MQSGSVLLFLLIFLAASSGLRGSIENQPTFKSAMVTSSQDLYDLLEKDSSTIFFVAFYIVEGKHEEVLDKVETSLWSKREIFSQVSYVPVDANDDYQFHGILYDLGILYESHEEYPFFLIIKNMEGHIVKGPKASEIIRNTILDLAEAKK